jgi:uncharacterized membrane protein YgcG
MFAQRCRDVWRPGARSVGLFVFTEKTEVAIEPSSSLQNVLLAPLAQAIAIDKVLPRLRGNDARGALRAGIDAIADHLRHKGVVPAPPPLELPLPPAPLTSASTPEQAGGAGTTEWLLIAAPVALVLVVVAFFALTGQKARAS